MYHIYKYLLYAIVDHKTVGRQQLSTTHPPDVRPLPVQFSFQVRFKLTPLFLINILISNSCKQIAPVWTTSTWRSAQGEEYRWRMQGRCTLKKWPIMQRGCWLMFWGGFLLLISIFDVGHGRCKTTFCLDIRYICFIYLFNLIPYVSSGALLHNSRLCVEQHGYELEMLNSSLDSQKMLVFRK